MDAIFSLSNAFRDDKSVQTIAPGSRLGYFVCNPLFAERLVRATEVVSQTPSGWSQAIVLELLRTWGTEGYLQWLSNLRSSYTVRRDWMVCVFCYVLIRAHSLFTLHIQCDALGEYFDLEPSSSGVETYGYLKSHNTLSERKPVISFVPPTVRSSGCLSSSSILTQYVRSSPGCSSM